MLKKHVPVSISLLIKGHSQLWDCTDMDTSKNLCLCSSYDTIYIIFG